MKTLIVVLTFLSAVVNTTPLGDLADTLTPGTWGVLNTNNYPDFSILSDNFAYANSGCWAEDSGFALFVGSVHAGHNHRLLTYVDSLNTWRYGPKLDGNVFPYTFGTHAYDNNAYDSKRGVFWYSPKGNDQSVACGSDYTCAMDHFRRRLIKYDIKTDLWDSGIVMPDTFPQMSNTTALKYFPEMDGLVYINSLNENLMARVFFYSFQTQTWRILGEGMPMGSLHFVCQYSAKNKCIIFGGGEKYSNIPIRTMHKIDSTGKITPIANMPEGLKWGIMCSSGYYATKFAEDPLTGELLALAADSSFWSYHVPTDYWQQLPKAPTLRVSGSIVAGIVIPVPRYNVMMYIWSNVNYYSKVKVYIYKNSHPHKDTVLPVAINVTAPSFTKECFLSIPLTVSVDFSDNKRDTVTSFANYRSLDTSIATVNGLGVVQGLRKGSAGIVVSFGNRLGTLVDTVTVTFTESMAAIDSVKLSTDPNAVYMTKNRYVLMQDSTYMVKGTVYGHSGSEYFSHPLDSGIVWTSLDTSVVTVNYGKVTAKGVGGPVAVVALQGGKRDTVIFSVYQKLKFIKRINCQNPGLAAPVGWLKLGYEDTWTSARGYGWSSGSPSDNNRAISGTNFLLQTRMISYSGTGLRIDLPSAGQYIIKAGMGNIVANTAAENWIANGIDTIMKWTDKAGQAGVQVDTISVGSNVLNLKFKGYLCYVVVMSMEESDINLVADDGNLADNIPGGHTTASETGKIQNAFDLGAGPIPANPSVKLTAYLPNVKEIADLSIFDGSGRVMRSWSLSSVSGKTSVVWDGNNNSGKPVSSGMYIVKLKSGSRSIAKRIVLSR
ncbi:MAG: Ig-like domain-containing protein [Fibrobacteres bacterium]|nr:Ig-like domain-containing protein [Fibrobacterota bacterium]